MINGGHVILYSKDAEADKEFIKNILKFKLLALRLAAAARRPINLAGRKARLIVCKLHVDAGKFGRHPRASQRRLAAELLLLVGKRAAAHLQRRPYRSGRDAIDANSF